jgi:DNA-binding transcriptional LysR family regulator
LRWIKQERDRNEPVRTIDIFSLDRYFPKWKMGLLLRKRKYLSPAVRAFIRTIKPDIQFGK